MGGDWGPEGEKDAWSAGVDLDILKLNSLQLRGSERSLQLLQSAGPPGPWRFCRNQIWKQIGHIKTWKGTQRDTTCGPEINHRDQLWDSATKQKPCPILTMLHNGSGRLLILIAAGWGRQWRASMTLHRSLRYTQAVWWSCSPTKQIGSAVICSDCSVIRTLRGQKSGTKVHTGEPRSMKPPQCLDTRIVLVIKLWYQEVVMWGNGRVEPHVCSSINVIIYRNNAVFTGSFILTNRTSIAIYWNISLFLW